MAIFYIVWLNRYTLILGHPMRIYKFQVLACIYPRCSFMLRYDEKKAQKDKEIHRTPLYTMHLLIYKCVSLDARSIVYVRSDAFTKIVRASVDAIIPYQNMFDIKGVR